MVILDGRNNKSHPLGLKGLRQAIYIFRELELGRTTDGLVKDFDGDQQLVDIWLSFLLHNRWIEQKGGQFVATEKGRGWAKKLHEEA